jgi:hypothetical protein
MSDTYTVPGWFLAAIVIIPAIIIFVVGQIVIHWRHIQHWLFRQRETQDEDVERRR